MVDSRFMHRAFERRTLATQLVDAFLGFDRQLFAFAQRRLQARARVLAGAQFRCARR